MEKEKAADLVVSIAFGVVAILWVIAWIKLQIIYLNRDLFWITLAFIPLSLIVGTISFFIGRNDDWYDEIYLYIVIGCSVLLIISVLSIGTFYQRGYSEEALKKEAELKKQLAEYEAILNMLTLQPIEEATNQVIEDLIEDNCKNQGYPCQQMKANFVIYKELKGWKDTADTIAKISWIK